ncbi:MAG TPA: hypothetical protein VFB65_10230, partial [Pyrinomonadaceae bacterium]|nr:hypothetical protein [Pyrinomonadaceae bacterium]
RATDQRGNQGNWKKFVCHNHRSVLLKKDRVLVRVRAVPHGSHAARAIPLLSGGVGSNADRAKL